MIDCEWAELGQGHGYLWERNYFMSGWPWRRNMDIDIYIKVYLVILYSDVVIPDRSSEWTAIFGDGQGTL